MTIIRQAMYTTKEVNTVKTVKSHTSAPSFRKGESHSVYMPEVTIWHGMAANMKPHILFTEWNPEVSLETKMMYKSLKFIWANKMYPANVNEDFVRMFYNYLL